MSTPPNDHDADAAQDDGADSTGFVLSLPPDLPAADAVTLGRARGLELSERDVQTIRSVAHATGGFESEPAPQGGWLSESVRWHGMVYVAINGLLMAINLSTTPGVLWFLWITATWGVGLFFHMMGARALERTARRVGKPRVPRHVAGRRDGRSQGAAPAGEAAESELAADGPEATDDVPASGRRSKRGKRHSRDKDEARTRRGKRGRRRGGGADASPDAIGEPAGGEADGDQADQADQADEEIRTHVRHVQDSGSDAATEWESELPAPGSGPTLRSGQRLAERFLIERPLGKGGMGEVYVARDEVLGEDVALKTISSALVGEQAIARFHREAQAARRVTHPNVIRIHDIGRDGDMSFISMEYVDGQTLGRLVHEELQLDYETLKQIALELCAGLAAAHAAGITHRDLKPDNVLLDRDGAVRIIDFGLAKLRAADGLTATGAVMGTPEYMAPEQMRGEPVDARTDVYAVGCILYHAIAGVPPFRRDSAVAIGVAHCHDAPPPLIDYRPDVPAAWAAIVERTLAKDPVDRFQDVAGLRAAIDSA